MRKPLPQHDANLVLYIVAKHKTSGISTHHTNMSNTLSDTANEKTQSSQSVFVQHLATYPAITAVAGLVASFPVVKIFASNAVPLIQAVHERTRKVSDPLVSAVEPALKRADELGDKVLTDLDNRFPALKTVQPADLVEGAQSRINSARASAQSAVDAHLIQPVANVAGAAKAQYTKVYDTQGRYIATIVNNQVGPVNERLESVISEYLPSDQALPPKEGTEVQRTFVLVKTAAERARPQIQEFEVSTRQYCVQVYQAKLKERDGEKETHSLISSLLAAVAAGRQITGEGLHRAAAISGLRPQEAKTTVSSDVEKAEAYITPSRTSSAVVAVEPVQAVAVPAH